MLDPHLAPNLRFACSYYPSVSYVCRKLGINRQQFNAYLAGAREPSRFNLKKICDFFGVETDEIFSPEENFKRLFSGKKGHFIVSPPVIEGLAAVLDEQPALLVKYEGLYHCYFASCASPGFVNRSLIAIKRIGPDYVVRTYERLGRAERTAQGRVPFFRRVGLLIQNTSRLFIIDYEQGENRTPAMMILVPSSRNVIERLWGIRLDVSSGAMQVPFAGRTLLEKLSAKTTLRTALKATGLLPSDSDAIPPDVREHISNELDINQQVLSVRA